MTTHFFKNLISKILLEGSAVTAILNFEGQRYAAEIFSCEGDNLEVFWTADRDHGTAHVSDIVEIQPDSVKLEQLVAANHAENAAHNKVMYDRFCA